MPDLRPKIKGAILLALPVGFLAIIAAFASAACEPGGLGGVCFDSDYDPSIRNPVKANDLMNEGLETSVNEHGLALMHFKGSLTFVDRDGVWTYRGGLGRIKWGDYGTIFTGGAARIACGESTRYRWRPDMIQWRCKNYNAPKADAEVQVTPINEDAFLIKFRYKCTDSEGCSGAGRQPWIQTKPKTGSQIAFQSNVNGYQGFKIHVDATSDKYDVPLDVNFYMLSNVPVNGNDPVEGKLFWNLGAGESKTFYVVFTAENRLAEVASYLSDPESHIAAATADVERFLNMFKYPSRASGNWEKQRYYFALWNYWYNLIGRYDDRPSNWGDTVVIKPGGTYNGLWIWDSFFAAWGLAAACKPESAECIDLGRDWVRVFFDNKYDDGQWPREVRDRKKNKGWQAPGGWSFAVLQLHKLRPNNGFLCEAYRELKSYHEWVRASADSDDDDLFEWGGTNSGWDGSVRWDPDGTEEAVDLQSWMIVDAESLREMAQSCAATEVAAWDARLSSYRQKAQKFWSSDWFYDLSRSQNAPAADEGGSTRSAAAYMFMLGDATTSAQETKLSQELKNPSTFGAVGNIGILPTVARNDHEFSPNGERTWSGANWMNINLVAWLGLRRQGREEDAKYLRDLTLKQLQMGQIGYESYNSNSGEKVTGGFGNWPYLWSDVAYIAMMQDWSPFTASSSPDIIPDLPTAPALLSPKNAATVTGDRVTLKFQASGAAEYKIFMDQNANPTSEVYRGAGATWTSNTLSPGTYYWKVAAIAGAELLASPVWKFTLQAGSITPPPVTPPPVESGTVETVTYYITETINNYNNGAFDAYHGGGWLDSNGEPGPTTSQFKRHIDQSRPHPAYLSVHSFVADESETCLYLKFKTAKLDTRLQTYLYPSLDELYADPAYKNNVRGLINGDELPVKFRMDGPSIAQYAAEFKSRFGYDLDLAKVADQKNIRARQDFHQFVSEGCRDGLNNVYSRLKARYPDWAVYYTPHLEYAVSWYYYPDSNRASIIEPVGLNYDGILIEGLYRYSDSPVYTNKVYAYTRLARAMSGAKPVCALLQNFWPAQSDPGIKNTWPEYIKYQTIQSYLAGADCIDYWSNDHFESNSPVYLSSVGGDRWAATVEAAKAVTGRPVYAPRNAIALVWGSYQVGANQNPGGISPLKNFLAIANLLTQWGVQFDVVLSKTAEADPSVLSAYKGLIVAGLDFEPQSVIDAIAAASAVKLYDDYTFKKGRTGEAVTFSPESSDIRQSGFLAATAQDVGSASAALRPAITSFLAASAVPESEYNIQDDQWISQARTGDGLWTLNAQGGFAYVAQAGGPCAPDWRCTTWSACVNNRTTRICGDRNSCGTSDGKPADSSACTQSDGVIDTFPAVPSAPLPGEPSPVGETPVQGGGSGGGGGGGAGGQSKSSEPKKGAGESSVTLLLRKPLGANPAASIQEAIGIQTNVTRNSSNLNVLSVIFLILVLSVTLLIFVVHQERVHVPEFARDIHVPFLAEAARLTQLEKILPGPGNVFFKGGYQNERLSLAPVFPRVARMLPEFKEEAQLRDILALIDERHRAAKQRNG